MAYAENGSRVSLMIRKVVIPSAGLGTRLFPATKEQPKEMLPIFSSTVNGNMAVKPLLQMVFEQLHDTGFQEFCFVVGRGKRSIEDHFTPDSNSVGMLQVMGKNGPATDLDSFYSKLKSSTIMWVNQPEARGFGNAVLMAQPFVQNERCLVHAGDTYIISKNVEHINRLINTYERLNADAAFIVQEIENPRQFGIIEADEVESGVYRVNAAVEKPEKPPTNLAIMPVYVFHPVIFKALEKTQPGKGGEIQLTDGIQKLIEWGLNVYAVKLNKDQIRLDIGSPETYWEALSLSYQHFCRKIETSVEYSMPLTHS
jgi:UTP--glucose-1-phosphate uridylyltransferase